MNIRALYFLSIQALSIASLVCQTQQQDIMTEPYNPIYLSGGEWYYELLGDAKFEFIPAIFDNITTRSGQIIITTEKEADAIFKKINAYIASKKYNCAAAGLEIVIFSMAEGKIPFSQTKFDAYKKTFLSILPHEGESMYGPIEPELYLTAGKMVEFIWKKQNNPGEAEKFMTDLLQEASRSKTQDFFGTMLDIWCKYHRMNGTLKTGIKHVQKMLESIAKNPSIATIFWINSPLGFLDVYFENIDVLGKEFVVQECVKTVDLLFSDFYPALIQYIKQHQKEIFEYTKEFIAWVDTDIKSTHDSAELAELANEVKILKDSLINGTVGVINLFHYKNFPNIAETLEKIINLMHEVYPNDKVQNFFAGAQSSFKELGMAISFDDKQ